MTALNDTKSRLESVLKSCNNQLVAETILKNLILLIRGDYTVQEELASSIFNAEIDSAIARGTVFGVDDMNFITETVDDNKNVIEQRKIINERLAMNVDKIDGINTNVGAGVGGAGGGGQKISEGGRRKTHRRRRRRTSKRNRKSQNRRRRTRCK